MWITHIHGSDFIGYGPRLTCQYCKNNTWQHVRQRYWQQKPMSVIPLPKLYEEYEVICHICTLGYRIKKKEKEKILEILAQGELANKYYYAHATIKEQEQMLKHLNRTGAYSISASLSFGESAVA